MNAQRRTFETRGPVDPAVNYVVPRSDEIRALVERIKRGRYTVIFAPRQTGKTTFFRWALDALVAEDDNYFPIQLNFETFGGDKVEVFYSELQHEMRKEILREFQRRGWTIASEFQQFLETYQLKDHHTFGRFLENLAVHLEYRKVAIIIDEFDGIPQVALTNFLHTLRRIYLAKRPDRCPHSIGIVGIRSISQLSYDRSISPFNIQDDFDLPNFTLEQVRGLLSQYTEETGQTVAADVLESLYEMTAGQPFLVNRLAQILTEEMEIPLSETIEKAHFVTAHQQILAEDNTHLSHLTTNIRRNPRFESVLMRITSYQEGVRFTVRNELISELATYGVVKRGKAGFCEIANPIYQYCIIDAFRPLFNGLEREYHPEDTRAGFLDYLTPEGTIDMLGLLKNFRDFIARAGYRILEVPDKPQEFVGQYLLFAYLDQFVLQVQGFIYAETYTGRGRMDLIILHNGRKYIVETKIWEGDILYQRGKSQLVDYLELEGIDEGYYVVFDHRKKPNVLQETEVIEGKSIMSFCIPVVQERPSDASVTE